MPLFASGKNKAPVPAHEQDKDFVACRFAGMLWFVAQLCAHFIDCARPPCNDGKSTHWLSIKEAFQQAASRRIVLEAAWNPLGKHS